MADKYQAMLGMGEDAPAQAAPPPPAGPDKYQAMLGMGDGSSMSQGSGRVNTGTGSLMSDPVDDIDRGAGFLTTMRASMAPDDTDKIRRFAAARFPSLNIDEAVKLYGIQDGNIVYYDTPKGQFVREVPSVSGAKGPLDAFNRVGRFVANETGAALPGVAGGVAAAFTGGTAALPVAAGTAAVTDLARQALDKATAGEKIDLNYGNAAGQAAGAIVGEGGGRLLTRLMSRNPLAVQTWERLQALDPARMQTAEAVMQEAQRRGLSLSVGEATELQSLLAQQRQLNRYPETTDRLNTRNRNEVEVPRAMRAELDQISPRVPIETAVGDAVEGAGNILTAANNRRTTLASPHYEQAFNSGTVPDITSTIGIIQNELANLAPNTAAARTLNRVQGMLTQVDPATNARVQSGNYRQMHSAKEALDGIMADINATGTSEEKRALRALELTQNDLTTNLRNAHPGYERGRQVFIDNSPAIEELERGGVGILSRKTALERRQMLNDLFESERITPEAVTRTRNAFLANGQRGQWDAAVRTYLDGKLAKAIEVNANGRTGNVPGKLSAELWGNEDQQAILRAAIGDPNRVAGMESLMEVLRRAALALPEGSPTATDLAAPMATDRVGGALRIAAKIGSPAAWLRGTEELAEAYTAMKTPQARRQLAEAIMDPASLRDLRNLRLLSPRSERAAEVTANILTRAGIIGAGSATGLRGDSYLEAPVASDIAKERSSQRPAAAR